MRNETNIKNDFFKHEIKKWIFFDRKCHQKLNFSEKVPKNGKFKESINWQILVKN